MKKAWLAAVLNLIPGLGYIYLDAKRILGWLLLGASVAFVITSFDPSLNIAGPEPEGIWILWYALAYLLPYTAFIIDGYVEAKKINAAFLPEKSQTTIAAGSSDLMSRATITPQKFAFLSLITFGLYQVYWGWRLWEIVRRSRGETYKVKSSLRAILLEFSSFSLFPQLQKLAKKEGHKINVDVVLIAGLYLIFGFVVSALSSLVKAPYNFVIVFASPLVSAAILIPVINMQNYYVKASKGKFTPPKTNWILVIVLALWLVLTSIVVVVAGRA